MNIGKKQITTEKLENILKNVKTEDELKTYMTEYGESFYGSFSEYFNDYIAENELNVSEIIRKSNVSKNYAYNIINGDRNPGRDKGLALCIGAGMNCRQINRALKITRHGALYPKNERDARIIIEINKGIDSVLKLNLILEEEKLEIIK